MKDPVRLFIAIKVSEKQKHELALFQAKMKNILDGVRWVKPENLHLTLKFFGEIEEDRIKLIKIAMDNCKTSIFEFKINYSRCGVFPSSHKAKVIWSGLDHGLAEVKNLALTLENNLTEYGFVQEKRDYYPHLTLGRFRYTIPAQIINKIIEQEKCFRTSTANFDGMVLMQSQLSQYGPIYTPIHKIVL